jgi:hypothetical protein
MMRCEETERKRQGLDELASPADSKTDNPVLTLPAIFLASVDLL